MLYVGLDVHSKFIEICALDGQGRAVRRGRVREVQDVLTVLRSLAEPCEVVYEASCGYGRLHELLQPLAQRSPQVGHRRKIGDAGVVDPLEHLLGTER